MSRFLTALLAGTAVLTVAGTADALTMSGGSASLNNTLTDYNTALIGNLTKFDTTFGTLNSITFTSGYGFNSTIAVTATTDSNGSVTTQSATKFYSTDSAINAVLDSFVNTKATAIIGASSLSPAAYNLYGDTQIYKQSAATTQAYASNADYTTKSNSSTTSSALAAFSAAGGGAITVGGQTLTGTNISQTGGNASATQTTFASQGFAISYDYSAPPPVTVPEPASMALLGAGLLGAGLLRRRAK